MNSAMELFSNPVRKEAIKTQTGVKAFNIWIYETERYRYALLAHIRLIENRNEIGKNFWTKTLKSTFLASTPGSMLVVADKSCVKQVANSICQNVRNIGNGKSHCDRTALLKRMREQLDVIQNKI